MSVVSEARVAAFSDIDGTITRDILLFPAARELNISRYISPIQLDLLREVRDDFQEGEMDYSTFMHQSLDRFAEAVRDRQASVIRHQVSEHLSIMSYLWVKPTFEAIQVAGGQVTLVTAEPEPIAAAVANVYNADFMSSRLATDDVGFYVGRMEHVLGSDEKAELVAERIVQIGASEVYVFGDTEGDIGMLEQAQPSSAAFCIRPDDVLRQHATATGMTIIDVPNTNRSLYPLAV